MEDLGLLLFCETKRNETKQNETKSNVEFSVTLETCTVSQKARTKRQQKHSLEHAQ